MPHPDINNLGDGCCGCAACKAVCPKGAVSMHEDTKGFNRPKVDVDICVACGACERVCPALNAMPHDANKATRWAIANDSRLTSRSSSGGVFALLANSFLTHGGAVYGAAFVDSCRTVRHVRIEKCEELDSVMRSKYLQSEIKSSIYHDIRTDLKTGIPVLFVGTACQVAGLRNYLSSCHADTSRLLLTDVICHGVPSPKLWRRWLDFMDSIKGKKIDCVNFRSKSSGWISFSVLYESDYQTIKEVQFNSDWYMKAFLTNTSLRPSCYACSAKGCCGSDLTLGDFWGVKRYYPEISEGRGVSAVIAHTERGIKALEDIRSNAEIGNCTYEEILAGNPSLEHSVLPGKEREAFMAALSSEMPISQMMKRWPFRKSLLKSIGGKAKALVLSKR